MLWHHCARVNSHQRWKQTWFRVCFHLWCELTPFNRPNHIWYNTLCTNIRKWVFFYEIKRDAITSFMYLILRVRITFSHFGTYVFVLSLETEKVASFSHKLFWDQGSQKVWYPFFSLIVIHQMLLKIWTEFSLLIPTLTIHVLRLHFWLEFQNPVGHFCHDQNFSLTFD